MFRVGKCGAALLTTILCVSCSRGGNSKSDSGSSGSSSVADSDKVLATTSASIGASGGTLSLPGQGDVIISPGATTIKVRMDTVASSLMENLAPDINPQFEFLPGVPKFRVTVDQVPTQMLTLIIEPKDLQTLIPLTHRWAVVLLTQVSEQESIETRPELTHVVGYLCRGGKAICVELLPEWLSLNSRTGQRVVQVGGGKLPHTCH